MPSPQAYPFFFVGHGPWAPKTRITATAYYLLFRTPPPVTQAEKIFGKSPLNPIPLPHLMRGKGELYSFGYEHSFDLGVAVGYAAHPPHVGEVPRLSAQEIQAFCDDVDAWLMKLHANTPLCLVFTFPQRKSDSWHRWSIHTESRCLIRDVLEIVKGHYPDLEEHVAKVKQAREKRTALKGKAAWLQPPKGWQAEDAAWLIRYVVGEVVEKPSPEFTEEDLDCLERLLLIARGSEEMGSEVTFTAEFFLYRLGRLYPNSHWLGVRRDRI